MSLRFLALVLLVSCAAVPAAARNIVISNDDGLTGNVKALYEVLKAEGHDVIVALPCSQQSGMGGAFKVGRLNALSEDCVNEAAKAGAPGVGPMSHPGAGKDFYYVNGTPVMATLYGIDVVAMQRWGKAPDILLSGPNVGQNVGHILLSSGTVSNAQYAMMRGIPAIALSAGANTGGDTDLSRRLSKVVAAHSLDLVRFLDAQSQGKSLLPAGTGLNVNFPDEPGGAKWALTRIGTYNRYDISFVMDLAAATGRQASGDGTALAGLWARRSKTKPDESQRQDEAAVVENRISLSVMQIGYEPPVEERKAVGALLADLFDR